MPTPIPTTPIIPAALALSEQWREREGGYDAVGFVAAVRGTFDVDLLEPSTLDGFMAGLVLSMTLKLDDLGATLLCLDGDTVGRVRETFGLDLGDEATLDGFVGGLAAATMTAGAVHSCGLSFVEMTIIQAACLIADRERANR